MNTTKENIESLLSRLGITLQSSTGLVQDSDGWECVAFQCAIFRNGKSIWSGPYKMGLGHVRMPIAPTAGFNDAEHNLYLRLKKAPNATVRDEYKSVKRSLFQKLVDHQRLTPTLPNLMSSLLMDGATSLDGESFEDFCANFGHDTDSRKAEATWRSCVETGMAIQRAFKREEIEELREAFQDY